MSSPCIASPRHFAGAELRLVDLYAMDDTVPRWLLRVSKAPRSGALARYLRRGHSEFGVLERTLTRQRVKAGRKWFEVELDVTVPILFRYLNTSSARFVRNRALAAPLNNWLAIQPKPGVDADALFRLLQQVSDSSALRGFDRDEYPPAVAREGGEGADVRYVRSSENRSAGGYMGNRLEPYCSGQPFRMLVVH